MNRPPDEFSCLWPNWNCLSFACGKFATIRRLIFAESRWWNKLTNHQQTVTNNTACHKLENKPPTNENTLSQLGAGLLQGICRMFMTFCLSSPCFKHVINLQYICFSFAKIRLVRTRPEEVLKKLFAACCTFVTLCLLHAISRHLFTYNAYAISFVIRLYKTCRLQ